MPPYLNTAPNKVSARHTGFAKWLGQRAAGVRQLHIKQGTLSDGGGCGSCCFLSSCFHSLEDAKDDGPVLSVSTGDTNDSFCCFFDELLQLQK